MARVTYERGIKCKKCGKIYISFDKFQHCVLCQNCGTHIMDFDLKNNKGKVTEKADIVTVKVTHRLFREIYEEI